MAMRHEGFEAYTLLPPAMDRRHVGLGPGFVDEDKARGINPLLILLPPVAPPGDVPAVLLSAMNGFF
jgi:hypothetical protein